MKIQWLTTKICFILMISLPIQANNNITSLTPLATKFFADLEGNENFKINSILNSDLYRASYLPTHIEIREDSISLTDLSADQSQLLHQILGKILSPYGHLNINIKLLINPLAQARIPGKAQPESNRNFVIKLYGQPKNNSWAMKLEGEHLSLSFQIINEQIKFIHFFLGLNLEQLSSSQYTLIQNHQEYISLGFQLLESLNNKQLSQAVFAEISPTDIMTNPKTSIRISDQWGIKSKKLSEQQRTYLEELIAAYIHLLNYKSMASVMEELEDDDFKGLRFAWAGSQNRKLKPFYYMIYNNELNIEFSLNQGHLHSIIRIEFKH